jgi:hypothetical protein|tara:strand:+ start:590 stop:1228 length:639 start_codon:yes stop_codon:yes gene_type:complete
MEHIEAEVLSPFGPRILKTTVPSETLALLNSFCDFLLKSDQREEQDIAKDLVGHVQEELSHDLEHTPDIGNMLFSLTKGLYEHCVPGPSEDIEKLVVHKSWFVRAFENDYNPTHMHTSGSYSCVLYLKVPETISDTNSKYVDKQATEGYLDFVYGTSLVCCPGNLCVQPKAGDLYVFPAYLFHTAYPFYGEGERRSFSANMSLAVRDSEKEV